jgi:chitin disaccharide deacetylase
MKQIIVNADDFGLDESVNNGIIRAHRMGILSSASLMANGRAFHHAVELSSSHPALDIGVHLTVIEEQPISSTELIPTLLNENGRFNPTINTFFSRYLLKKISLREIATEFDAQIRKILDHDIVITHLDSHQHAHIIPGVLQLVISLAKKYNIPYIRLPHEKLHTSIVLPEINIKRLFQQIVLNGFCYAGKITKRIQSLFFLGFYFGGNLTEERLLKLITYLPGDGPYELMCHPGETAHVEGYNHWNYHWPVELSALISPKVREMIERCNIEIVSRRKLTDRRYLPT